MITSDLPRGTFVDRNLPSLISVEIAWPVFDASGLKLIVPASTGAPSTAIVPSTVLTGNADPPQPATATQRNSPATPMFLIGTPDYRTTHARSTKNQHALIAPNSPVRQGPCP